MTDEAAFIAAIREAPDDLSRRLVYADWLEERGERLGELIRCRVQHKQCETCRGLNSWVCKECNYAAKREQELAPQIDAPFIAQIRQHAGNLVEYCETCKGSGSVYEVVLKGKVELRPHGGKTCPTCRGVRCFSKPPLADWALLLWLSLDWRAGHVANFNGVVWSLSPHLANSWLALPFYATQTLHAKAVVSVTTANGRVEWMLLKPDSPGGRITRPGSTFDNLREAFKEAAANMEEAVIILPDKFPLEAAEFRVLEQISKAEREALRDRLAMIRYNASFELLRYVNSRLFAKPGA